MGVWGYGGGTKTGDGGEVRNSHRIWVEIKMLHVDPPISNQPRCSNPEYSLEGPARVTIVRFEDDIVPVLDAAMHSELKDTFAGKIASSGPGGGPRV